MSSDYITSFRKSATMTEKQEAAEDSESLYDRIWQRFISVIPFLWLFSGIVFLLSKYLFYSEGALAFILMCIITLGIMLLIPLIAGHIYKNRWVGCCLAFLIPLVFFMEVMFQFPFYHVDDMFFIATFCAHLGILNYVLAHIILSPLVNTENMKKEDVVCIQIFSRLEDVEKLIKYVLSHLTFSHVKRTISDKERQWKLGRLPSSYYLHARSDDDNSVDLAFLFFTEGANELYRSEQNHNDLNFIKETIRCYFGLHNIEYKSIQNPSFSSDILDLSLKKYKSVGVGEKLRDFGITVKTNFKVIILLLIPIFVGIIGRDTITQVYNAYPWVFILIAALIYPLIIYIRKMLKESDEK